MNMIFRKLPSIRVFSSVLFGLGLSLAMPVAVLAADTTPPAVGSIAPLTGVYGSSVNFYTGVSDNTLVTSCNLYVDEGSIIEAMSLSGPLNQSGGLAQVEMLLGAGTFPVGNHTVKAQCSDAAGNVTFGATKTFVVTAPSDTQKPTVGAVTPTTGASGSQVIFYASFSDDFGVSSCNLMANNTINGMTLQHYASPVGQPSSGSASVNLMLSSQAFPVGTHVFKVQCFDDAGNWAYGANTNVTVTAAAPADTTAPAVPAVTPTTVTTNVAAMISVQPTDSVGVVSCALYEDSDSMGAMTNNSGVWTKSVTLSAGAHNLHAECRDAANNIGFGANTVVTAGSAIVDSAAPIVGTVSPMSATLNAMVSYSVTYSDNVGVVACQLHETSSAGATSYPMTLSNGTASKSLALSIGTHQLRVGCNDAASNFGFGEWVTVTVSSAVPQGPDTTVPSVNQIAQSSAVVGSMINLSATYSDNVGVTACTLYVNGADVGNMSLSNGTASKSYTFNSVGNYNASVSCRDAAGNIKMSDVRTVTVLTAPPIGSVGPGSLVKLVCPSGAAVDHGCKAVYYYGSDGKRHAFPNERIYFTWYTNFDGVKEVSDSFMFSLGLGKNVTYRPGVKMVKFTTVPKVYAVSKYGVLRWVTSEAIATAYYGSTWNKQIDDLSDAFFTNYSFGTDVNLISDYNPAGETAAATTIDANL